MQDLDPQDLAALSVPIVVFWGLLYMGRSELGIRGIVIFLCICFAMVVGWFVLGISLPFVLAALAVVDIVLVIIIFGGDFRIT